jgi:hypothetical protein
MFAADTWTKAGMLPLLRDIAIPPLVMLAADTSIKAGMLSLLRDIAIPPPVLIALNLAFGSPWNEPGWTNVP